VLDRTGKKAFVILPVDEYESLLEDLQDLAVCLQFIHGLALAENAGNFSDSAIVPAIIDPILQREVPQHVQISYGRHHFWRTDPSSPLNIDSRIKLPSLFCNGQLLEGGTVSVLGLAGLPSLWQNLCNPFRARLITDGRQRWSK